MPALYGQKGNNVREILFTFDDGPSKTQTPKLLDTLAANEIKAVFFVVGSLLNTSEGRAIVERAQQEGHTIGNHTFTHPNLKTLNPNKIRDELRRTHDLVCECTGACRLFRPSFGAINSTVLDVLQELSYTQMLWNVDTLDWKLKKDAQWVEHGMDQIKVREDCIVLMHDIHATTVDNVDRLIKRVRQLKNTDFVPFQ